MNRNMMSYYYTTYYGHGYTYNMFVNVDFI